MSELLSLIVELNFALAGAVSAVLLIRRPCRKAFGPRASYGLWSAAPVTMLAVCLPRITPEVDLPAAAAPAEFAMIVLAIWISGAIVSAGLMLSAQARFFDQARRGVAGPAVVGVIIGRLVMPADSADRWSIEERAAIRDHERAHLERGDLRVNALAALLQCLFWWNPFAHLGITWFRFDQELACDAAVMAQRPGRRRLYAEALLKAVPTAPLAFGCGWTTAGVGALATRLDSLRLPRHTPDMKDRLTILAFALTTATVAWAVQPASAERQRLKPTPVLNLRLLPPAPPDAS